MKINSKRKCIKQTGFWTKMTNPNIKKNKTKTYIKGIRNYLQGLRSLMHGHMFRGRFITVEKATECLRTLARIKTRCQEYPDVYQVWEKLSAQFSYLLADDSSTESEISFMDLDNLTTYSHKTKDIVDDQRVTEIVIDNQQETEVCLDDQHETETVVDNQHETEIITDNRQESTFYDENLKESGQVFDSQMLYDEYYINTIPNLETSLTVNAENIEKQLLNLEANSYISETELMSYNKKNDSTQLANLQTVDSTEILCTVNASENLINTSDISEIQNYTQKSVQQSANVKNNETKSYEDCYKTSLTDDLNVNSCRGKDEHNLVNYNTVSKHVNPKEKSNNNESQNVKNKKVEKSTKKRRGRPTKKCNNIIMEKSNVQNLEINLHQEPQKTLPNTSQMKQTELLTVQNSIDDESATIETILLTSSSECEPNVAVVNDQNCYNLTKNLNDMNINKNSDDINLHTYDFGQSDMLLLPTNDIPEKQYACYDWLKNVNTVNISTVTSHVPLDELDNIDWEKDFD